MKTIRFIKAHPSGIEVGKTIPVLDGFADRMVQEGFAVIDGEESPDAATEPEPMATIAAPEQPAVEAAEKVEGNSGELNPIIEKDEKEGATEPEDQA